MKKFFKEFKDFIMKGNILDMAVGMIIALSFKGVVESLTKEFLQPVLDLCMAKEVEETVSWGAHASAFLTVLVEFIITAFILFCVVKLINKAMSIGKKKEEEPAPTTKTCPFCKTEISIEATKCPNCTSNLEEAKQEA